VAYALGGGREWDIEIYPTTGPGARVPVSVDGGVEPIWGASGELFYRHPITHAMMHVQVSTRDGLEVGTPKRLFEASEYRGFTTGDPHSWFDVTADGQRFLMLQPVKDAAATAPQLILVQNWFEELKRLVPTKR
jgi:hypothetical protein